MAGDSKLIRRGPLDGVAEQLTKSSSEAVRLELLPPRSVLNLRGATADQSIVTDAQRVLGIELPLVPNHWHGDARIAAVWLGPDEWLIIAPDGKAGEIEQNMREARPMDPWLSLVDVSHTCASILLSGPRVRHVLAKGCAVNLNPPSFTGGCAQTIIARSRVLLRALDGESSIELWVRNSLACYTVAWLLDACVEFRGGSEANA